MNREHIPEHRGFPALCTTRDGCRNVVGKREFAGSHHLSRRSHTAAAACFSSAPRIALENPEELRGWARQGGNGEGAAPYSPCARAALVHPCPLGILSHPHHPGGGHSEEADRVLTSSPQRDQAGPGQVPMPPSGPPRTHLSPRVSQQTPSTLGEASHTSRVRTPGSPTGRDGALPHAHPTRLHPCSALPVPCHPSSLERLSGHTRSHPGRGEKSQSRLL